jgi:hypothetical protein
MAQGRVPRCYTLRSPCLHLRLLCLQPLLLLLLLRLPVLLLLISLV